MTSTTPTSKTPGNTGVDIFLTSWLKKSPVSKERIRLSYDSSTHILILEKLGQSLLQRFSSFVLGGTNEQLSVNTLRVFTDIEKEQFDKEKSLLAALDAKKTSIEEMIKVVEKDLEEHQIDGTTSSEKSDGTTSGAGQAHLTSEAILERQHKIQELRSQLEDLNREIEAAAPPPALKNLRDSIAKVKEAVQEIFRKLSSLEQLIANPDEETARQFNELRRESTLDPLSQQIHEIRQTLVEELELETQADAFTATIDRYPEHLQLEWRAFIDDWKALSGSLKPSPAKAAERKQGLEEAMAKLHRGLQNDVLSLIEKGRRAFETKTATLDNAVNLGKSKTAAFIKLRDLLIDERTRQWNRLRETSKNGAIDLATMERAKNQTAAMELADGTLLESLIPPSQGILSKIWTYPSELLFGAKDDPISVLELTNKLLDDKLTENMKGLSAAVEELLWILYSDEDKKTLGLKISDFRNIFDPVSPEQDKINSFIEDLVKKAEEKLLQNESYKGSHRILQGKLREMIALNTLQSLINASKKMNLVSFADAVKGKYTQLFSEKNHPKLRDLAHELYQTLQLRKFNFSDSAIMSPEDKDLKEFAAKQVEALGALYKIMQHHAEYSAIADDLERKVKILTGAEAEKGKAALQELRHALQFFSHPNDPKVELTTKNLDYLIDRIPDYYEDLLVRSEKIVTDILDHEDMKREIVRQIGQLVSEYDKFINGNFSQIKYLEERLAVTFDDARARLEASRKAFAEKKSKGSFSTGYVGKTWDLLPWSETRPKGEFEVSSLSLNMLKEYFDQLKRELVREKSRIGSIIPLENVKQQLEAYDDQVDAAQERILLLKADFSVKNPALRSEERLQFKNASILEKELKKLEDEQDAYFKEQSKAAHERTKKEDENGQGMASSIGRIFLGSGSQDYLLKTIGIHLKSDSDAIFYMIEKSENMENLSLLDQIGKLEDDKDSQRQAKKALLESMGEKIESHAKATRAVINKLEKYKGVHAESKKLIGEPWKTLERRLAGNPLKKHAAGKMNANDPAVLPSPASDDLDLDHLSLRDLTSYHRQMEETFESSVQHLRYLESLHDKAKEAETLLTRTIKTATQKSMELDNADQMITKAKLSQVLEEVTGIVEGKNDDESTLSAIWSKLPQFSTLFGTWQKNATTKALSEYTYLIGDMIGKIKAAVETASKEQEVPLRDQMGLVRANDPEYKDVRERILLRSDQMLSKAAKSLKEYKEDANMLVGTFIPINSSFNSNLTDVIDEEMRAVQKMKEEHITTYRWIDSFKRMTGLDAILPFSGREKIGKLTRSDQLVDYYDRASKAITTTELIDQNYGLKRLSEKYKSYKASLMKGQLAAEKYKSKDAFYNAYLIESKLTTFDFILNWEWKNQVNSLTQVEKLAKELKAYVTLINERVDTVTRTAPTHQVELEDQLERLVTISKQLTNDEEGFLEIRRTKGREVAEDLRTHETEIISKYVNGLKLGIAASVKTKYEEYSAYLKSLINGKDGKPGEIEKICKFFNIAPLLRDRTYIVAELEYETFESGIPTMETGNRLDPLHPLVDELMPITGPGGSAPFRGQMHSLIDLFATSKSVAEMTPEEIIRLRPNKQIKQMIKDGKVKISQSFSFIDLQKKYQEFEKARKHAEEVRDAKMKDGQFLAVFKINTRLAPIEELFERYQKAPQISDDVVVRTIIDRLKTLTEELNELSRKILADPILTYEQQSRLIPAAFPPEEVKMNELRDELIKNMNSGLVALIHNLFDTEIKKIAEEKGKIESLCDSLEMPKPWRKMFANAYSKEADADAMNALLKPRKINGKSVSFDLLPFDTLVAIKNDLQKITRDNDKKLKSLRLDALKIQVNDLQKQIARGNKQRVVWQKERRMDSIKQFDDFVSTSLRERKLFFDAPLLLNAHGIDVTGNAIALINLLTQHSYDFNALIKSIGEMVKVPFGDMLLAEPVGTEKHIEIRESIREVTSEKLSNQMDVLTEYSKGIEEIKSLFKTLTKDKETIPASWGLSAQSRIDVWKERLDKLLLGHAALENPAELYHESQVEYTPFDDLNVNTVILYEQSVNNLVDPLVREKGDKDGLIMKAVHYSIKLKDLKKELTHFSSNLAALERNIKNAVGKKKVHLKAMVEAYTQLVVTNLKRMTTSESSINSLNSLRQANASITNTVQEYTQNKHELSIDPWLIVYNWDKVAKTPANEEAVKKNIDLIVKKGFFTTHEDIYHNRIAHESISLHDMIDLARDEIAAVRNELREQIGSSLLPPNFQAITARQDLLDSTVRLLNNLDELKDHFEGHRDGRDVLLQVNAIDNFTDLVKYQNEVYKMVDQWNHQKYTLQEAIWPFWETPPELFHPEASARRERAHPPAGGAGAPPPPGPAGAQPPAGGAGAPPPPDPAGAPLPVQVPKRPLPRADSPAIVAPSLNVSRTTIVYDLSDTIYDMMELAVQKNLDVSTHKTELLNILVDPNLNQEELLGELKNLHREVTNMILASGGDAAPIAQSNKRIQDLFKANLNEVLNGSYSLIKQFVDIADFNGLKLKRYENDVNQWRKLTDRADILANKDQLYDQIEREINTFDALDQCDMNAVFRQIREQIDHLFED